MVSWRTLKVARNCVSLLVDFEPRVAQAADMAREVVERLVDDIDGSEAVETISFGLDGAAFAIDLNEQHATDLRAKLGPYVRAGRRVRGRTSRGRVGVRRGNEYTDRNAAIRLWAFEAGIELPSRGRISRAVQDAYDAEDVAGLYAATGLEMEEQPPPRRSRRRAARSELSADG